MPFDFISQSTSSRRRLHAAIIMDGNGRWATMRGLPRLAGHRAGADAVRRTVEAAPDLGVGILTLYAFSSDNWRRPPAEVSALMELLDIYLRKETRRCLENGVRLEVIGRRDRLDPRLVAAIARTEAATAAGETLTLRVAVDYSAREAIRDGRIGPDVDLLIRTGGEQRLSDFLLWECAYAELIFSKRMWPDFDGHDLAAAVREFQTRERRFGGVPEVQPVANGNGGRHHVSWLD
jgi:undecaprenyl diphosphate synthase